MDRCEVPLICVWALTDEICQLLTVIVASPFLQPPGLVF